MKTIFDYLEEGEVIDNACLVAAKCLIERNIHVIPLKGKEPIPGISVSKLRTNPIHTGNVNFYFDRESVGIGIMLSRSMEVLDIDEKEYAGITRRVLSAIELGWPELFEKLCISKTPSGGAHIYYFADTIGGDAILAKRHASPNPRAFIERIDETNKQYIKTAPSPGYYFQQHNPLTLPWLSSEERGWLVALCQSFNEVIIPEVKKPDYKRDDSPWNVFNKAKDWTYIITELQERGWETVMDLKDRVVVNRPGSHQRHSGSVWKESNRLYLFTSSSEFEPNKAYSPFGVYAQFYHDGNIYHASKQLSAEGYGIDITTEGQFWRKEGKRLKIKYTELVQWLYAIGYRKYQRDIVQVINNRVKIVDITAMSRAFLNEVEPDVRDDMFEKVSTIFSDTGGLMAMLPELNESFLRDDAATTWMFFENTAVKITADEVQPVLYNQLTGLIWDNSILKRKFYPSTNTDCDIKKFIHILGGENYRKLEQILGYALSRYKDPLVTKAIVIMEDIDAESEGESQGRSGKGLLFKIVSQFRKGCRMNGKGFSFQNTFLWQDVELDTDLILIDDVEKNFQFSKLYSMLTEGIHINRKNLKQIFIPYEDSPKLFITSNFAVGNMDDSTKDRKFEFPVVKHFSSSHKPLQEFGRPFFTSWSDEDWQRFDNYMVSCASAYLSITDSNITVTTDNSMDRSLIHDTSREFVDFMDDQLSSRFFLFAPNVLKNDTVTQGGKTVTNAVNLYTFQSHQHDADYYLTIDKKDLLEKVVEITKYKGLSLSTLTKWFKKWAEVRNVTIDPEYKRTAIAARQYRVVWWPELELLGIPTLSDPEQPGISF